MNLVCQKEAISNLTTLAEHHQHGVLIVGNSGCGKTHIARHYANLLSISDFYIINPVIADLKAMIDQCAGSGNPVVLCIENLDEGVTQASYPLLKLIEDCPANLYVVVTCCNMYAIPDTIISRCAVVTINPPTQSDLGGYAQAQNITAYTALKDQPIWACVKSLTDADAVLKLTPEQLKYFNELPNLSGYKDSVSNIAWKLQHYEDRTDTPIVLVIRYLMGISSDHDKRACVECLNDLADNKVSKNAIISRLVFELKYTE